MIRRQFLLGLDSVVFSRLTKLTFSLDAGQVVNDLASPRGRYTEWMKSIRRLSLVCFSAVVMAEGQSDLPANSANQLVSVSADSTKTTSYHTVTARVRDWGGSVSPTSVGVAEGRSWIFTVTANSEHYIASVTGCNGSLPDPADDEPPGNSDDDPPTSERFYGNLSFYTTGPITAPCTVIASFGTYPSPPPDQTPSVPQKPKIIRTDFGDGEIYLYASSSAVYGWDISGFTATCSDGTNVLTGKSTSSPITVYGLTNGVAYTCTVTATNSVGTSAVSAATDPITPEEQVDGGLPIWLLYQISQ